LNESDPTLVVEQRSTKGSTENAPLLAEGKIDIGLATGEVTYEALAGIGRPPANLKIIQPMYPNSGMFMVRGDSPYRNHRRPEGQAHRLGRGGIGLRGARALRVRRPGDGHQQGFLADLFPERGRRSEDGARRPRGRTVGRRRRLAGIRRDSETGRRVHALSRRPPRS